MRILLAALTCPKGDLDGNLARHLEVLAAAAAQGCDVVVFPEMSLTGYEVGAAVDLDHPQALPATLARLGVEHLLLTLGEHGMALISADGEPHRVPTTARDVYDVVGAGDTVTAYLAVMLAAGATAREAAVIANYAAGVEVGKLGAQSVTADEVRAAYEEHVGDALAAS